VFVDAETPISKQRQNELALRQCSRHITNRVPTNQIKTSATKAEYQRVPNQCPIQRQFKKTVEALPISDLSNEKTRIHFRHRASVISKPFLGSLDAIDFGEKRKGAYLTIPRKARPMHPKSNNKNSCIEYFSSPNILPKEELA
jgi:hypothetical protein